MATRTPQLQEDEDTLSLHFAFPTIQSRMIKAEPERLDLDYTQTMMGFLLFKSTPEFIAMIGLGGGSIAKYCRRNLPESDFTAVEIAPQVIALRDKFGIPEDGPLFRVILADGAEFIRSKSESYDALLIDGFDSDGQPNQLCSLSFYDDCRNAIRQGGLLVVNLCSDDPACRIYISRIRGAFKEKVIAVEAEEGENIIVFAFKDGNFPPEFEELAARLRLLEAAHPVNLGRTAQKILYPQKKNDGKRHRRR